MSDTEEEDDDPPVTKIANRLSECLNVVAPLLSTPEWVRFCETAAAGERKQSILSRLSQFLNAAPWVEQPTLHGPKPMMRRLIAVAAELHPLVAAWDDATEPSAAMVTTARRFFDCLNDPESHLDLP